MKNRTVYLAGKVTGLPRFWVVLKFTVYDLFLTFMGYDIWNPIKIVPKGRTWHESMDICLEGIEVCDYIYFIPDWRTSDGARIEMLEAASNDKILLNSGYKIKSVYNLLKSVL